MEAGEDPLPDGRVRRPGGGRRATEDLDPDLVPALLALVEPDERGDPVSPLRWTTKSLRNLAEELTREGHPVSAPTVGRLLREQGFSLQASATGLAGTPTALAMAGHPRRTTWPGTWPPRRPAPACPGQCWPASARSNPTTAAPPLPGVHSGSNSAGAEGPMQFEPATFAEYAVNADPGQPLSPYDPADAIYTAAAMLCASGARGGSPAGLQQAVFAYNHAQWYVSEVMAWAAKYATQGGSHAAAHRDRVREGPARQALPVGRGRAGRL